MPKAEIHGLFVIQGMAHRETSELGREGVGVRTKKVYLVSLHSNHWIMIMGVARVKV